jgi:AraC family transcriptional regulator
VTGRYQDTYPSDALLRSFDIVRLRAGDLMSLEYFEAEPASMPMQAYDQHHILLNVNPRSERVENWRETGHRDFVYALDEVVVTPAGQLNGWRWHARSKVIVVTLEPARLATFAQTELGLILTQKQLMSVPQVHDPDLVSAGKMALDALKAADTASVMFDALARVFLVKLIKRYGEERAEALDFIRGFSAEQYKRVLDHVAAHFAEPVSVDDLASVAGMSASHFQRLFKLVLNETPYQFLTDYRIERAKEMLADPNRSLSDIALACGFADQPHLTRVFKQATGKTPRAWRLETA